MGKSFVCIRVTTEHANSDRVPKLTCQIARISLFYQVRTYLCYYLSYAEIVAPLLEEISLSLYHIYSLPDMIDRVHNTASKRCHKRIPSLSTDSLRHTTVQYSGTK